MKENKIKIPVLFEDENILVLDKPAGLSAHGDGIREEYTLADYILENYPYIKGIGENMIVEDKQIQKIKPKLWKGQIEDPERNFKTKKERINKSKNLSLNNVDADRLQDEDSESSEIENKNKIVERPGIVHRLDKDTSGVMIIAKNKKSFNNLKEQFQNKTVKKEYIALVYGWPKVNTGIIDKPIARSKSDFRKKEIAGNKKGGIDHRGEEREAVTRYKVIKNIDIRGDKIAIVNFYPLTGRMHQLRVHAKSIGHPIVGDHLYGYKNILLEKEIFGENKSRQLLHAINISFKDLSGDELKIVSQAPKQIDILTKKI